MLTGTVPPRHGVRDNFDHKLGHSNVTLAEILGRSGFTTGAIVSGFVLDSQSGLDQGFESYHDRFEGPAETSTVSERGGGETSRLALEWPERHKNESFFLFLHYYDPHTEYAPPETFASRFPSNPYAGEIAYTDHCIGQVIEHFSEAVRIKPESDDAHNNLGVSVSNRGRITEAIQCFSEAVRINPNNEKARDDLEKVLAVRSAD